MRQRGRPLADFDQPVRCRNAASLKQAHWPYETAGVSEEGIRFKNLTYSNEFIRDQRMAKGSERIAAPGEKLEIKVDPMNLGAISVFADGDLISVQCLDDKMHGKSLNWWMGEQERQRAEARLDVVSKAAAKAEAQSAWRGEADAIAKSNQINMKGRTPQQIERLKREMGFGKGEHEKPFVGRDEYRDPTLTGFETDVEMSDEIGDSASDSEAEANTGFANPLDRFRSKGKRASHSTTKKGDVQ